jgi:hypothetical protein
MKKKTYPDFWVIAIVFALLLCAVVVWQSESLQPTSPLILTLSNR